MPVKRRVSKQIAQPTDQQWRWLMGEPSGWFGKLQPAEELREFWLAHQDEALEDWIARRPGTRPPAWWHFAAPEPRRRLGGVGTPYDDAMGHPRNFYRGLPRHWLQAKHLGFASGALIDANDPPRFEAEAEYLARHGLFMKGERKRLKDADFAPELVLGNIASAICFGVRAPQGASGDALD